MSKVIFLVDMQSFFASVELAKIPGGINRPLVVSGDPSRRSGVILAACPQAKQFGIENGERLWEARKKCPGVVVVRPHMQEYLDSSLAITEILESYTDLVEPYSIDEQFMDVTASQRLFGSPEEIARKIQDDILKQVRVKARVGIGENKVLAKMACDNFAKKAPSGIFHLKKDELETVLWPLPIDKLFRAGGKMTKHLHRMGIFTIGDLANTEMKRIKDRWGVHGQVLWMNARGVDYSPVSTETTIGQKAIGNGMTLPRDYAHEKEIRVVLLELCEEVCRRARGAGVMGQTVSLGFSGADYDNPSGFYRQITMLEPSNMTMTIYHHACELMEIHWDGLPIRRLNVSVSNLRSDQDIQLSLFDPKKPAKIDLGYVIDDLNLKYGKTAVKRAVSLLAASQLDERAAKIGGHYK